MSVFSSPSSLIFFLPSILPFLYFPDTSQATPRPPTHRLCKAHLGSTFDKEEHVRQVPPCQTSSPLSLLHHPPTKHPDSLPPTPTGDSRYTNTDIATCRIRRSTRYWPIRCRQVSCPFRRVEEKKHIPPLLFWTGEPARSPYARPLHMRGRRPGTAVEPHPSRRHVDFVSFVSANHV